MAYFDISTATSFGVPQPDGSMKGYSFNDGQGQGVQPSVTTSNPSLPGATIGTGGWWWPGTNAQTPGGTPNPVAAYAGLNWPSPGAIGVPPGTPSGGGSADDWKSWIGARGVAMILGLVFIGGGVASFARS